MVLRPFSGLNWQTLQVTLILEGRCKTTQKARSLHSNQLSLQAKPLRFLSTCRHFATETHLSPDTWHHQVEPAVFSIKIETEKNRFAHNIFFMPTTELYIVRLSKGSSNLNYCSQHQWTKDGYQLSFRLRLNSRPYRFTEPNYSCSRIFQSRNFRLSNLQRALGTYHFLWGGGVWRF